MNPKLARIQQMSLSDAIINQKINRLRATQKSLRAAGAHLQLARAADKAIYIDHQLAFVAAYEGLLEEEADSPDKEIWLEQLREGYESVRFHLDNE